MGCSSCSLLTRPVKSPFYYLQLVQQTGYKNLPLRNQCNVRGSIKHGCESIWRGQGGHVPQLVQPDVLGLPSLQHRRHRHLRRKQNDLLEESDFDFETNTLLSRSENNSTFMFFLVTIGMFILVGATGSKMFSPRPTLNKY